VKILFIAGPTKSSLFGLTPLAIAARTGGRQVVMAATQEVVPAALGIGLPAFPMTPFSFTELMTAERAGNSSGTMTALPAGVPQLRSPRCRPPTLRSRPRSLRCRYRAHSSRNS
jgi:hypothetical protein